jgi:hypothetical protein
MATAKKLGLSPERTEPSKSGEETEFFVRGDGKKLGLSPERTEPPISGEEAEFFVHGDAISTGKLKKAGLKSSRPYLLKMSLSQIFTQLTANGRMSQAA